MTGSIIEPVISVVNFQKRSLDLQINILKITVEAGFGGLLMKGLKYIKRR
jgi:hypothetical protein